MFKKISVLDLLKSKTFWGAVTALIPLLISAWGHYEASKSILGLLQELGPILGGFLAAIGLIDRTA